MPGSYFSKRNLRHLLSNLNPCGLVCFERMNKSLRVKQFHVFKTTTEKPETKNKTLKLCSIEEKTNALVLRAMLGKDILTEL